MSVYPPNLFYENTRQTLSANIIHISSGSCLLPVPSCFRDFINQHYLENVTTLLSDYGESAGPLSIRQNMANLENFRTNTQYYSTDNVFITLGTTEGIDISLLMLSRHYRQVFLLYPVILLHWFLRSSIQYGAAQYMCFG
jgi:aspartate/methionine/tyrosine aminotransferase